MIQLLLFLCICITSDAFVTRSIIRKPLSLHMVGESTNSEKNYNQHLSKAINHKSIVAGLVAFTLLPSMSNAIVAGKEGEYLNQPTAQFNQEVS